MAFDLDEIELKSTRKLLGIDKKDNIEKNINNLKKYVEEDKIYEDYKNNKLNEFSDFDMFCINHCKDIEKLLSDYTRQKQINEEHQKENGLLREKVKELEKQIEYDKTHIFTPMTIDLNYIPKQNIVDKIQERKFELQQEYKDFEDDKILQVLQELL